MYRWVLGSIGVAPYTYIYREHIYKVWDSRDGPASRSCSSSSGAAAGAPRCDSGDGDVRVHEPAIDLLATEGILDRTGCAGGLSCPRDPIHRWVVALWLVRAPGHQPFAEGAPTCPRGRSGPPASASELVWAQDRRDRSLPGPPHGLPSEGGLVRGVNDQWPVAGRGPVGRHFPVCSTGRLSGALPCRVPSDLPAVTDHRLEGPSSLDNEARRWRDRPP